VEVGLIVLGAALALVGGIVVDVLKTLRAGRAAAITIFGEVQENGARFSGWFRRAYKDLNLDPEGPIPSGPLFGTPVLHLSADELRQFAELTRPLFPLRPFPSQVRDAWTSQSAAFSQVAGFETTLVGAFYQVSTDASADTVPPPTLERVGQLAEDACDEVVDLTLWEWAKRSMRDWRRVRKAKRAEADEEADDAHEREDDSPSRRG
jgi:hypothetical protein